MEVANTPAWNRSGGWIVLLSLELQAAPPLEGPSWDESSGLTWRESSGGLTDSGIGVTKTSSKSSSESGAVSGEGEQFMRAEPPCELDTFSGEGVM